MPQQFVELRGNQGPNFDNLMTNLAENVRYRRATAQRKQQDLNEIQQQQAQGLIPQGSFKVTDNGVRFGDQFWENLSQQAMQERRSDDMTQRGGTNSSAEVLDDPVAMYNQVMDRALPAMTNPAVERINQGIINAPLEESGQFGHASTIEKNRKQEGIPGPVREVPAAPQYDRNSLLEKALSAQQSQLDMVRPPMAPPAPNSQEGSQPASTPESQKPSKPIQSKTTITERFGTSEGKRARLDVSAKQGNVDYEFTPSTKTTVERRADIRDEIKQNVRSLAGMAALQSTFNRGGNNAGYNQSTGNIYSDLMKMRQANLLRAEEALSQQGRTENVTAAKTVVKTDGSQAKFTESEAAQTTINVSPSMSLNTGDKGEGAWDPATHGMHWGNKEIPAAQIKKVTLPGGDIDYLINNVSASPQEEYIMEPYRNTDGSSPTFDVSKIWARTSEYLRRNMDPNDILEVQLEKNPGSSVLYYPDQQVWKVKTGGKEVAVDNNDPRVKAVMNQKDKIATIKMFTKGQKRENWQVTSNTLMGSKVPKSFLELISDRATASKASQKR